MKTAVRKNSTRWVTMPHNREHGAAGQNRSCSIKWAAKQKDLRPSQKCFFLTSPFIELTGFDSTPLGKPARVTWTEPAKPFCPATETVMVVVVPCGRERALEEREIAKSGVGAGAGWAIAGEPPPPPPHPAHARDSRGRNLGRLRRNGPMAAMALRSVRACKIL